MKGGEIQSNLDKEEIIKKAFEFHSKGNISKAQELYQIFISRGFSDVRVYSNYGVILRNFEKLKEAELYTRKAIELNPNFASAYSNLGGIFQDLSLIHI